MLKYFDKDFLETNVRYLQAMLLWPPDITDKYWKRVLYLTAFWTGFIITFIPLVTSEIIYIILNPNDYVQTIRSTSFLMLHIIYIYKLTAWTWDKNKAASCIQILYRASYNFDDFSISDVSILTENKIMEIFENNDEASKITPEEYQKAIRKNITSETNIHSSILMFVIIISVFWANIFIYFDCLYVIIQEIIFSTKIEKRPFPVNIYVPFDISDIKVYFTVFMYLISISNYLTMQYIGIDFFFWSMLIQMDGQVRVIKFALQNINIKPGVTSFYDMNSQFGRCTRELQQLIKLLDILKSIYSIPLLLQYIFVMIVSCCVMYTLMQEDNIYTAIGLVGFLTCALTNSFFNIYYITQLTHQFTDVPNMLYSMNWVDSEVKFQKQILFAIARMQKTIGIEMGNMIKVDLNVFVKILQKTYSIFTLLQAK